MNYIITGYSGFIGGHFFRDLLRQSYDKIFVVDKVSTEHLYKSGAYGVIPKKVTYITSDINDLTIEMFNEIRDKDITLVNFAAETHVDRSIENPREFLESNIIGVDNLLGIANRLPSCLYVQMSTDEIAGDCTGKEPFKEDAHYLPSNPYSASKAAAEMLITSAHRTYGLEYLIFRACNNYGPLQTSDKLIPMCISYIKEHKSIPVYGDGSATRQWIYVKDTTSAIIDTLYRVQTGYGSINRTLNIAGPSEHSIIDVIDNLADVWWKGDHNHKDLMHYVDDRPGHDYRYALDGSLLQKEGWTPKVKFKQGLKSTLDFYTGL